MLRVAACVQLEPDFHRMQGKADVRRILRTGMQALACLALLMAAPAGAQTLRMVAHSDLEGSRPDLDHGLHHPQPRLSDLRLAVCQGRLRIQPPMVGTLRDGLEGRVTAKDFNWKCVRLE